jgi:hypothetical protein
LDVLGDNISNRDAVPKTSDYSVARVALFVAALASLHESCQRVRDLFDAYALERRHVIEVVELVEANRPKGYRVNEWIRLSCLPVDA